MKIFLYIAGGLILFVCLVLSYSVPGVIVGAMLVCTGAIVDALERCARAIIREWRERSAK